MEDCDFDIAYVSVETITVGKEEILQKELQIIIHEDFSECSIPEITSLRKQAKDKSKEYTSQTGTSNTYIEYQTIRHELHNVILNINRKLLSRICKKYDYELQDVEAVESPLL